MNSARPAALHCRRDSLVDVTRPSGRRWLSGVLLLGCCALAQGVPAQAPPAMLADGLVRIRAGQFQMGSAGSEVGRNDDEGPVHTVRVSAFALARYAVTRADYAQFVTATGHENSGACLVWQNEHFQAAAGADWRHPGFEQTDQEPVVCVSWNDARAYVAWLSGKTGAHYRLPTEAEYEYATRAGTTGPRFWDTGDSHACSYADVADSTAQHLIPGGDRWTVHPCDDGHAYTAPVGSYKPNAYGLYDMLGNVWEWVEDCYHSSYEEAPVDGSAWTGEPCSQHVLRGGSWAAYPTAVRSAQRLWFGPDIRLNVMGFRVARGLP